MRLRHRRAGVAQEVPGRIDEGVHGVGLAARRARRTSGSCTRRTRRSCRADCRCHRAPDPPAARTGSCSSGTGTSPQPGAVDERNRAAPVALARNAPVAQAALHALGAAGPCASSAAAMASTARLEVKAGEFAGVHRDAVLAVRVLPGRGDRLVGARGRRAPPCAMGRCPSRRELEIALIVRRHAHDGALAVAHQHVVGDPHLAPARR